MQSQPTNMNTVPDSSAIMRVLRARSPPKRGGNGIMTSLVERVATQDTLTGEPATPQRSEPLDGGQSVLGACWHIPTTGREPRRYAAAVKLNTAHGKPARQACKPPPGPSAKRRALVVHWRPAFRTRRSRDATSRSCSTVAVRGVAISSTSYPAAGSPTS